jgi:Protein of unknown function (DUF3300)
MRQQLQKISRRTVAGLCLLGLTILPFTGFSQVPVPAPLPQQPPPIAVDDGQPVPVMAANQLDGLVAPIALYPDPLISQILVAATYPLEVVEAYQFTQRNPGLNGPALTQAAAEQNWDPSVQALVVFPDVLKRLNEDVNWTTALGNAFLNQQADVMSAIQRMRQSAEQSGRLVTTPQQQVINTVEEGQPVVEIVPANPEVIYVPVYDPAWVWGPAVYYPYAHWYYPPVYHTGFFFGVGIGLGGFFGPSWGGWGGWGWHPGWGTRTIVVNNTFIRNNHFNTTRIASVRGPSVWTHDSFHRQGVAYPNQAVSRRFEGNNRANFSAPRNSGPANFQSARSFNQSRPAVNEGARPAIRENWNARNENRSFQQSAPNAQRMPSQARSFTQSTPAPARNFAPQQQNRSFTPSAPARNFEPQQNRSFTPQARSFTPSAPMASAAPRQDRGHFNSAPERSFQAPRQESPRSFQAPRQESRSFQSAPRQESHGGGNGGGGGHQSSSRGQGGHSHR